MRIRRLLACAPAIAMVTVLATSVRANTGIQLPLNQYQAGTETATLVPNGGFESATAGEADAPWSELGGGMSVGAHLGPNASAPILGSNAASAAAIDLTEYHQTIGTGLMNPAVNNVLSGYVWNYGIPGPAPHTVTDFDPGDMGVVELKDASNTVNFILEAIALDNGSAADGYYVYATIPAGTFPTGAELSVRCDLDSTGPWPAVVMQFDNIAITPESQFVAPSQVPEPTSSILLALLAPFALRRRRR